jgi:uncharacterized repeat protein (TIGR01451 family)
LGSGVGAIGGLPVPGNTYIRALALDGQHQLYVGGVFKSAGTKPSDFIALWHEPLADLGVSVSDAPDPAILGEMLHYTFTVANEGPAQAMGVSLIDHLPGGLSFVGADPGCAEVGGVVTCTVGLLGEGISSTIVVTATPLVTGRITSTAVVTGSLPDLYLANNTGAAGTTIGHARVAAVPGLSSTLVYTDGLGSPISAQLSGAAVTDKAVLLYTEVASPSTPLAGFQFAGQAFTLDAYQAGVRQPGFVFSKPVTVTIGYRQADIAGLHEGTLELRRWNGSWSQDGLTLVQRSPADNLVTFSVTQLSEFALFGLALEDSLADLRLSVSDGPDPVAISETLRYTASVTNDGPHQALDVSLVSQLPSGVDFLGASAGCGEVGGVVTCTIGQLDQGISSTVVLTTTPLAPGKITNTLEVTGSVPDPALMNNSSASGTTVGHARTVATPGFGSTLVYTDGPGSSFGVQLPGGAVSDSVVLLYTEVATPTTSAPGLFFAGRAFLLDAYRQGALLAGFAFSQPVTVTVGYRDADIDGLDEELLGLRYWSAGWSSDGITTIERDQSGNKLAASVDHLSEFALFGPLVEEYRVYLPLVLRDQ